MTERLQGKAYRARRRLTDKDGHILADVGDLCQFVPVASLPALLASGKIELIVDRRKAPPAAKPSTREPRR